MFHDCCGDTPGLKWQKEVGQACVLFILLDTIENPGWPNDVLISTLLQRSYFDRSCENHVSLYLLVLVH
jgi:hypothetical protein